MLRNFHFPPALRCFDFRWPLDRFKGVPEASNEFLNIVKTSKVEDVVHAVVFLCLVAVALKDIAREFYYLHVIGSYA